MLNFLTCSHFSTLVYIQKQLRLTIAEAIIKSSGAILSSSVSEW